MFGLSPILALTMDEWTKIGVIFGIVSVIVGVLFGGLPIYLRWLDNRLNFDVKAKGSIVTGPLFATFPGEKIKPYSRFEIKATVVNRSRVPVHLKSIELLDRGRTSSLSFVSDNKSTVELAPGARLERIIELGTPRPFSGLRDDHRDLESHLVDNLCVDGSFIEVVTADERVYREWARKICGENFLGWPVMLRIVHEKINPPTISEQNP